MTIVNSTSTHNTQAYAGRRIEYIVIHYTAGVSSAAGCAASTANYYKTTTTEVSSDYIVDDAYCVLYNPDIRNRYTWHCGGEKYNNRGGSFYGRCKNSNSIGIEICSRNSTGRIQYANDKSFSFTAAAVNNAVELTKSLMKQYGIDAAHVIRHYDVTGKPCPGIIGWNTESGSESAWKDFKSRIQGGSSATPTSTSSNKLYRVRKEWGDPKTQIGAYSTLNAAKKACKSGYTVFDPYGKAIYKDGKNIVDNSVPNVLYRAFTNNKWSGTIKNDAGFAGQENAPVCGFAIKSGLGIIKYRVHILGGGWLNWIKEYNVNDWNKGCAGIKGKAIDAIQMELTNYPGYQIQYRVSYAKDNNYLPWVKGLNDYAGIMGHPIDKIQAKIIKL